MVKKHFFLLAVICFSLLCAKAQNRYVDSLIDWVDTHPKVDCVYLVNLHRISYRLSEKDVKKSFYYYERASYLSDSINCAYGKALAQINLSMLLFNSANFDASNQALFKALAYAEENKYLRLQAIALNNIGENFKTLKDFEKCREYTRKAIILNKQLNNGRGVAVNYELLHQCDMDEKQYASAAANLRVGIDSALASRDSYIISQYYMGFGRLQAVFNHTDSATYYFNKALAEAKLENDLRNEYAVYLNRASSLKTRNAKERITDLHRALEIAQQTDYLKGNADAAEQLSNLYDEQANKDSSLYYFRIYRSASDLLFSENNKRNVVIKESEWVLHKKEIENNQLKDITTIQKKEIVTKNGLLLGGAIILALVMATGVLAVISIRSKNKRVELQKKQQEAELRSQITDMEFKAFKAQLNPHFIFNYLNSISGYILLSQPQKASDMVKRFSKMLRKVLQNSELNEVPLADDIKTIEQYLELMHEIATPPFTYIIHASDELRQLQQPVPPLFIQPYVENAVVHGLKHAEGDAHFLEITYQQKGGSLEILVTDNGTGFNPKMLSLQPVNSNEVHLGLSVTEKRIQVFAEKNGYGADVTFSTPFPGTAQPGTRVQVMIEHFFNGKQAGSPEVGKTESLQSFSIPKC